MPSRSPAAIGWDKTGLDLSHMPIQCSYLPEPFLVFGNDGLHVSPKSGIARFGPRSFAPEKRHPARVRVGLIGTAETTEKAHEWLETCAEGVQGDEFNPEFPGYRRDRGFFSEMEFDDGWNELITQTELKAILAIRSGADRFQQAVLLLDGKLRLLAEKDHAPDYVLVALDRQLVSRSGVADYDDRDLGEVHHDLRRAVKAVAMKYRIPTQLLQQRTMEWKDKTPYSRIAWNFFTGLYFKAGGFPWGPHGLKPGTCYVGIGFYRPLGSKFPSMQTSLVQAFDEHGEGLVLRGHDFEWDPSKEGSRSPHLTEAQAAELVDMVLMRYEREMKQVPTRVVVHKTSRYWPGERAGFAAALSNRVNRFDLMAMQPQSIARLITMSKYPPLRGTRFTTGDLDFLYTTGFIASLNEFHGTHVPSPVQIADHVGQDTPRDDLLREVLLLTKMNFNSAHFGGLLPITLKFSKWVGEIMRELPPEIDPLPQFKFYM